jgi:hypothetical protein
VVRLESYYQNAAARIYTQNNTALVPEYFQLRIDNDHRPSKAEYRTAGDIER